NRFLVADAMKENQALAGHHRPAVAFAHFSLPEPQWPVLSPGEGQSRFRRHAVALGAQELRPIAGQGHGRAKEQDRWGAEGDCTMRNHGSFLSCPESGPRSATCWA